MKIIDARRDSNLFAFPIETDVDEASAAAKALVRLVPWTRSGKPRRWERSSYGVTVGRRSNQR